MLLFLSCCFCVVVFVVFIEIDFMARLSWKKPIQEACDFLKSLTINEDGSKPKRVVRSPYIGQLELSVQLQKNGMAVEESICEQMGYPLIMFLSLISYHVCYPPSLQ